MQLPWRSAPRAALSSPLTVLVAVVAALLLTFVGAAAVLHADSAGNAAVSYQAGRLCPQSVGPVADNNRVTAAAGATVLDTAARRGAEHGFPTAVGALYSPVRQWDFNGPHPWARFGWREGAMDNLTVLQGGSRDGLWVPRSVAENGQVTLGERPIGGTLPPVTAIYDDITDPVPGYWCSEREQVVLNPLAPEGGNAAVVFFPDRAGFLAAMGPLSGNSVTVSVRFPLPRLPETVEEGADVVARGEAALSALKADLPDAALVRTDTYFARPVQAARDSGATVGGAVLPLTVISLLVGLAGVAAVTVQWCQRRRAELRLLWSRGAGPLALGLRAVLELAAPLLLGAVAGWLIARLTLPFYAPSPALTPGTAALSAVVATGVLAAALLVVVAVTSAHTHRALQAPARRRHGCGLRHLPWELGTAVLAYLAWARLDATPTRLAFGQPLPETADAVGLAFPLLVVLTVALVAVRLTRWALGASHRLAWWRVPAAQLAVRRLAAATGSAIGILLVGVLAVGTLTVGVGIATAQDDAFDTKSGLFVGAESTAQIPTRVATDPAGLPADITDRATVVGVVKSGRDVIIAVDPATFTRSAWVDGDPDDLAAQLALLTGAGAGGPVPALRVGTAPGTPATLPRVGDVRPVGHLPSFPLIGTGRGYVVATTAVPDPGDIDVWQVWSPEPVRALVARLDAADIHHLRARSKTEALDGLPFLTVRWTFDFVTALGFVLAVVAAAALLLAVEVRRRQNALAGALATRMGLRPRTLVASHLLELGSLAGLSVLAGSAAGWACTAVSAPMLDPSPWLRPLAAAPDLVGLVSTTLATALVVVALVCWSAVRSVTTARVGELIRG
ncbi:ABC transporter permease [Actinokineospora sp. 24-640]